jgi:hypothetical protein
VACTGFAEGLQERGEEDRFGAAWVRGWCSVSQPSQSSALSLGVSVLVGLALWAAAEIVGFALYGFIQSRLRLRELIRQEIEQETGEEGRRPSQAGHTAQGASLTLRSSGPMNKLFDIGEKEEDVEEEEEEEEKDNEEANR